MAEALIYTFGRERIGEAGSTPVDIQHLRNLLGDLVLEDINAGSTTLSQLLAKSGEAHTSGLRRGPGGAVLSMLSATQVRLTVPGAPGVLVQRQADGVTIEHDVTWAQIDHTVTGVAGPVSYYVIQDVGFTGTGTLLELSSPPSDETLREPYILIGASYHWGGEVRRVVNFPSIWNDQGFRLDDFIDIGSKVRKKSGRTSETPVTLSIEHTAIVLNCRGINFGTSFIQPNAVTIPASGAAVQFNSIKPDGNEFNVGLTTMPSVWNNAGVETVLSGSEAAVHQIAMGPDGQVFAQIGTKAYANYATAVASIQAEVDDNPLWDGVTQFGTRLGYVVISANATVWMDGHSHFFEHLQSGDAGGAPAAQRWTDLLDTPDDMTGKAGQVPKANTGETDLEFGKIRASIQIAPRLVNVDASGGAVLNVAMPTRFGAASMILDNVHFEVVTAPSGADLEMDVMVNGVTIYGGTKPKILDGQIQADAVPTVLTHTKGDKIRLDILDGNATWEYLTVTLEGWVIPEV